MVDNSCILLIEPDYVLRRTYGQALTQARYDVLATGSAEEAIHLADDRKPDAVILELQLILHGGTEFIYEFRSYPEWQDVPILLLTFTPPTSLNFTNELVDNFNIAGYLYKPSTSLPKLLRAVSEITIAKRLIGS